MVDNIFNIIECKYCNRLGYTYDGLIKTPCSICTGTGRIEIDLGILQELKDCKFCFGSGYTYQGLTKIPCPACKGLGKIIFTKQLGSILSECKFCSSFGYVYDGLDKNVCPTCKGVGLTYPKRLTPKTSSDSKATKDATVTSRNFKYHVAVSFAGEDRQIVKKYADELISQGLKVFYDEYEQSILWGTDLYQRLDDVYRNKACYCVIFISEHYANKLWTNHELKSAQARAFRDNAPYILPVKLDDTQLPGIRETIGYIDLRSTSLEQLISSTIQKISDFVNKNKNHY